MGRFFKLITICLLLGLSCSLFAMKKKQEKTKKKQQLVKKINTKKFLIIRRLSLKKSKKKDSKRGKQNNKKKNLENLHNKNKKNKLPEKKGSQEKVDKEAYKFKGFIPWVKACCKLPSLSDDETYYTVLTREEFLKAAKNFIKTIKAGPLFDKNFWLKGEIPFLQMTRHKFFVEKIILGHDKVLIVISDIHGDIHALNLCLLCDIEDNSFKIKNKDLHFVFLGDYVDRGIYGTEVLYTLMRLKIDNPDRVFLLRGNHEDISLNAHHGFMQEYMTKFPESSSDLFAEVDDVYNFLPAAIYLGTKKRGTHYFALFCHAGLEYRFDPRALLEDKKTHLYQHVDKLNFDWIDKSSPPWFVLELCKDEKSFQCLPKVTSDIGFFWDYFNMFDDEEKSYVQKRFVFSLSKKITEKLLALMSSKKNKICVIFRGHQHTDKAFKSFAKNFGVHNCWPQKKFNKEKLTNIPLSKCGVVWTICPIYSPYRKRYNCDFVPYVVITLGKKYKDWKIDICNIERLQKKN